MADLCGGCRCGAVRYRAGGTPFDVTACSLDDPAVLVPEDHIFTQQQVPWVRLADGLPRHAGARPPVVA